MDAVLQAMGFGGSCVSAFNPFKCFTVPIEMGRRQKARRISAHACTEVSSGKGVSNVARGRLLADGGVCVCNDNDTHNVRPCTWMSAGT